MKERTTSIQRILIVGAGRGGAAMLDLFLKDPQLSIVGIMDLDPHAPALAIAAKNGIPSFTNLKEAIAACPHCLVLNLTTDESVTAEAETQLGVKRVIGGFQAHFLWKVITRLKKTIDQVVYLAQHDALTKLPNRNLFYDRLEQAIARASRYNELIGILYLDLDGFKRVNDTLGHDTGDALLREAAKRIKACIRDSDTVARMGGDEFTVIICNCRTPESICNVASKIIAAFESPFLLNENSCRAGVSIGISFYPGNGKAPDRLVRMVDATTTDQLVKIADAAMYVAKKQPGKNCYHTELALDHTLLESSRVAGASASQSP